MSESKHTQGPWRLGGNAGIWAKKSTQLVSILYCLDEEDVFRVCDEEANANARLIAAAPDLLEACLMGLELAKMLNHPNEHHIEAAIAKTKGE